MAKKRIPIPEDVAATVLFASHHTCCKCNEPLKAIQIHHIDDNPANNDVSNLAVLCTQCHDETQIRGGFGRKLNACSVVKYRDDWHQRIAKRRDKVDELAVSRMAGLNEQVDSIEDEPEDWMIPADPILVAYANSLPSTLESAYSVAQPRFDSGIMYEMIDSSNDLIHLVEQMLVKLASFYPSNHFDQQPVGKYFEQYITSRAKWHRALAEPGGLGSGGREVSILVAVAILSDSKEAVEEMVSSLLWGREGFSFKAWKIAWSRATQS